MARLFTGSTLQYDVADQSQLPWDEIQAACGRTFDTAQREDVFEFRRCLQHEAGFFQQSYLHSDIENLRTELYGLCRQIDKTIRTARRREGFNSRLIALAAYLGGGSGKTLDELARVARDAGFALKEPRGRTAHVVDVRSVQAHVFKHALAMGRSRDGEGSPMRAKTWGLNPSPRSGPFRRFLAALLGIEEPSEDDLRNALRAIESKRTREGGNSGAG